MNRLLCTLFLSFTSILVFTQEQEIFTIRLDGFEAPEKVSLPFSAIKIIDARFDQSNIGCVVKNLSFKGMTQDKMLAVFPDSFTTYLPRIFNNLVVLNKTNADTLVMFVKQFRIADHLINTLDNYHEQETVLAISASFYAVVNDQLRKIFSIDDKMAAKWKVSGELSKTDNPSLRAGTIMQLLAAIFPNKIWTPSHLSFSWSDVENGMKKRFQLPVFTDRILTVGLYKTFEEFKNNSPSFTRIHLGMLDSELVQVVDENYEVIALKNYWGACDGQNQYIVYKGGLYKLIPSDKSFRICSYRQEIKEKGKLLKEVVSGLLLEPSNGYGYTVNQPPGKKVKPEYFYLNMDTGIMHLEELIGTEAYEKGRQNF